MKAKILSLLTLIFLAPAGLSAAQLDTLKTFSSAMRKDIPAIVIRPSSYSPAQRYPVLYLLHGFGGSYANWADLVEHSAADRYNLIMVLPDGGVGSWYFDSPVDTTFRYETYITQELLPLIDRTYSTIAEPRGRAISGLSMGGHGALYLAFRHQNLFGAAGSTSGGVDFRPFPNSWHIARRLGTYAAHPDSWERNTVVNMLHLLNPAGTLALIIDCGTEDFFYTVNCRLHDELRYRNIPHDFITRPGAHNGAYWRNAIKYQLLFFHTFFER